MNGFMTIYKNQAPHEDESKVIYDGGTIVSRAVTEFAVQKVWVGLEEDEVPPEITLTLYCNGVPMDKKTPKPDEYGWYHYYNLPMYRNGMPAEYTVVEEPLADFTTTYSGGADATFAMNGETITNTKVPPTGDTSNLLLWSAMLICTACGLVILNRRKKAYPPGLLSHRRQSLFI